MKRQCVTAFEFQQLMAAPAAKGHKFHTKTCDEYANELTVDQAREYRAEGRLVFPSKLEAHRYQVLKLRLRAGEIEAINLQPHFMLQVGYRLRNGEWIKPIVYIADFCYFEGPGKVFVIEDTKGMWTPEAKLKVKIFLFQRPDVVFRIIREERRAR
jgi:hypothetical protein